MQPIHSVESISDLSNLFNQEKPQHPLVATVDFSKLQRYGKEDSRITTGFYSMMLKTNCHGKLKYGRAYYDFSEGTLICVGPNQVLTFEGSPEHQEEVEGWGLFFHPDLIRGTSLGRKIKDYSFFSYEINEALHLSEKEKLILRECLEKIENEISQNIDKHSQTLIVSNIELMLNYCARFYDRQFITRNVPNKDLLARFETILQGHFEAEDLGRKGIPSVQQCAEQLHLSANYLSDLLKRETGKNAQEHIHYYLIEKAKSKLLSSNLSINEVAYTLGFDYPQYFSKLFKQKTGKTPVQFRNLN